MHYLLVLPNLLIESFWHLFVTVGGSKCLIGDPCRISPDQNNFRSMLLNFHIIFSTLQLFNSLEVKSNWMIRLLLLTTLINWFLVLLKEVVFDGWCWWFTFLFVFHPVSWATLPMFFFKQVIFSWTVVVFFVGINLLLFVITICSSLSPGVDSFYFDLDLIALVYVMDHLTIVFLILFSKVLNRIVVV